MHEQRAAMDGVVVVAARSHQIGRLVAAIVGTGEHMVNVQERCAAATWDTAATAIAAQNGAAHGRRDLLLRDSAFDPLGVAGGALDDLRIDRDAQPAAFLLTPAALLAHGEHDLVRRPAVVARPTEREARHHRQRLLVVQVPTMRLAQRADRLTKQRKDVSGDVEPKHVAARLGPGRIARTVARVANRVAWPSSAWRPQGGHPETWKTRQ
jgi:hypothetical protein